MMNKLLKTLSITILAAMMALSACTSAKKPSTPNDGADQSTPAQSAVSSNAPSKEKETDAPRAKWYESEDEKEKLVLSLFRCMDEGRYGDLAALIAPEERGAYESLNSRHKGDTTGVRNIASAVVTDISPYELGENQFFTRSLKRYSEIEGARAAYRVKTDITLYDKDGAFADLAGTAEQIVRKKTPPGASRRTNPK